MMILYIIMHEYDHSHICSLYFVVTTSIFEALAPSFQIGFSLMSHSLGGTGEAIYHLPRVNQSAC